MKRYGTVLVFKKGVKKHDIEKALRSIAHVLQPDYFLKRDAKSYLQYAPYRVEEYDDKLGGPVWYLP